MLENTKKANTAKANASINKAQKEMPVKAATAVKVQTCMLGSGYVRGQVLAQDF